ncbi:MAG: chorismate mutase [Lentisphaerae bacterium]|nr:chorismate mutase [Lentisphaerota bacterium]
MNLDELRQQVDDIDRDLMDLLCRRAETALKIGREKQRQGTAIHDPDREEAVLKHVSALNRGPLRSEDVRRLFRDIMAACTRLQENVPGPKASSGTGAGGEARGGRGPSA